MDGETVRSIITTIAQLASVAMGGWLTYAITSRSDAKKKTLEKEDRLRELRRTALEDARQRHERLAPLVRTASGFLLDKSKGFREKRMVDFYADYQKVMTTVVTTDRPLTVSAFVPAQVYEKESELSRQLALLARECGLGTDNPEINKLAEAITVTSATLYGILLQRFRETYGADAEDARDLAAASAMLRRIMPPEAKHSTLPPPPN